MTRHGPGVTWLAERAGCTPEELIGDPRRLLEALGAAGADLAGLAVGLDSADEDRRAEAERSAEALRARLAGGPDPGEVFRARVTQALRDAADRVRRDPPAG